MAEQPRDLELVQNDASDTLIFYIPGADGSGAAIEPQLPQLAAFGLAVRAVYIPPGNRSTWAELVEVTQHFIAKHAARRRVIVLAESFGVCLALRVSLRAPQCISHLVLINSATCFSRALGGLPSLLTSTGLLSYFPEPLFEVAQAVVLPMLISTRRTPGAARQSLKSMMSLTAPAEASADAQSWSDMLDPAEARRTLFGCAPAEAVNFRLSLLQSGDMPDSAIASIRVPALVLCSVKDRLFPSLREGARLQRLMPNAKRVLLPYSAHAPMLESDVSMLQLMQHAAVLPAQPAHRIEQEELVAHDRGVLETAVSANGAVAQSRNGATTTLSDNVAYTVPTSKTARSAQRAHAPAAAGARGVRLEQSTSPQVSQSGQEPSTSETVSDSFEENFARFRVWHDAIAPLSLGVENIPTRQALGKRPILFVGNHTQFGLYDMPLLFMELYTRGYKLTGLAHPQHWETPLGAFFEDCGAIKASPLAAYRALRRGSNVLLFPGGGREVAKRKGEQYRLIWKEGVDFVRLAARTNAVIVPFGAVGADDAFDLFMDTDEILAHPVLGPLSKALYQPVTSTDATLDEAVMPITKIPGTPLPSPVPLSNFGRVYFKFGQPIDTQPLDVKDASACQHTYDSCRASVEQLIEELLLFRADDPARSGWTRLRSAIQEDVSAVTTGFGLQEPART